MSSTISCIHLALFGSSHYIRHELYHAVRGVKRKTAPSFWDNHQLCVKGGFARVGVLSMKSFSSSGVVAPRWGPKGGDNCDEKDGG